MFCISICSAVVVGVVGVVVVDDLGDAATDDNRIEQKMNITILDILLSEEKKIIYVSSSLKGMFFGIRRLLPCPS